MTADSPALMAGAALACGLMIGVERGWRLRDQEPGTRVAGVRTFTLLGAGGGIGGLLGQLVSPFLTAVIAASLAAGVLIGFWREVGRRDATSAVAAIIAVALGLLAGAGEPALAVAGAAVTTLVLATRTETHAFIDRLNTKDVHAFARYAVIAGAVLPFLPNRQVGPLGAWNPFQLWLVVVLITGFSFAGYVANRTIGARKGVLATAVIGGAYSSTAATASLSHRLGSGEEGPFATGISVTSAMMYLRVVLVVAVLTPSTLPSFLLVIGPAAVVGVGVSALLWLRARPAPEQSSEIPGNPIELIPALGFVAIVAIAAVATKWAQGRFGEEGIATSLFLTGSFDVDAAIVTLAGLPVDAISRNLAALALAGTIAANMILKMLIVAIYARARGHGALLALAASTATLLVSLLGWARSQGFI
jgi:uncharacterized membrane protein (DUF4010 family)